MVVQARGGDTSEDDDMPFSMIAKATAKKWVEKNKFNKKMDKTAEDYVQRVLVLISSGSSDRAELRTRKARAEAQAEMGLWTHCLWLPKPVFTIIRSCAELSSALRKFKASGNSDVCL